MSLGLGFARPRLIPTYQTLRWVLFLQGTVIIPIGLGEIPAKTGISNALCRIVCSESGMFELAELLQGKEVCRLLLSGGCRTRRAQRGELHREYALKVR